MDPVWSGPKEPTGIGKAPIPQNIEVDLPSESSTEGVVNGTPGFDETLSVSDSWDRPHLSISCL